MSTSDKMVGWSSYCDSAYSSDESPTLKTNLRCELCKKLHPERRVLPCEHWFCPPCLASVLPQESLTLSCPTCGEQSIVPEQGLIALPTTFFYQKTRYARRMSSKCCQTCHASHDVRWKCQTCLEKVFCTACMDSHKTLETDHVVAEFDDQTSECSTPRKLSTHVLCEVHPGSMLMFYCSDCDSPLCHKCQAEPNAHSQHSLTLLKNGTTQNGNCLADDNLPPELKAKWLDMQKALEDCDSLSDSLSKHSSDEAAIISESFNRLSKLLEQRKQILSSHLKETTERKFRAVATRKSELQKSITTDFKKQMNGGVELDATSFPHLAALRKTIGKISGPCTNGIEDGQVDKEPEDFPKYVGLYEKTVENLIGQMGKISTQKNIATMVEAKGEGLRSCCLNQKTTIFLTTKNHLGIPVSVDSGGLEASITSRFGKKACNVQIKEGLLAGNYDLVYSLHQEGLFMLNIKLYEQHMLGSPFNVRCVGESEYSTDHCSVHSKQRSFISSRSSIATKSRNHSKSPSSSRRSNTALIEDDLILKVGHRGRGLGQFTNPQGICSTKDGRIVVADSNNQNIQIFTEDGECILKFGTPGRGPGNMQRPVGVAALPNGNLLVADYDNKWINVFEENGKYLGRFGAGVLLGPKGIAVDNDNHVILVDNKSSTIFVYDMHKFKLIKKFGSRGDRPHQFAGPHYVAVSAQNHLYISDFHHHCVKVFDISGQHMFSFGSNGMGNGQFNAPTGIAIDQNQNVFVADWGNNRVQV